MSDRPEAQAPEIERCTCGDAAYVTSQPTGPTGSLLSSGPMVFWVKCGDPDCWDGPAHQIEEAAIAAWNRVMRAARKVES